MLTIRKLGENVEQYTPEQRQQIELDLADAIRNEGDPMIRVQIVRTLGKYPGTRSNAVLNAAIRDPDSAVRLAVVEAWTARGGVEGVPCLVEMLEGDADQDVKLAAARALGKTKDPRAVAALGKSLDDNDPAMQRRAVLALQENTGKEYGSDVNQWRQYVRGETPQPKQQQQSISIAEHLRHMF